MPNVDASRVTVGSALATGAIFIAVDGTALPTDATTSLSAAWHCIGYTSDAGLSISESANNDAKRAWEGLAEVISTKTQYQEQISFTPIECNAEVAELMWGSGHVSVALDGSLTIQHHGQTMDPVMCVIETVPRSGIVNRRTCRVQLQDRDTQTLNGSDLDGRQLTFDCLADSNGVTMTEYVAFTSAPYTDNALLASLVIGTLNLTPVFDPTIDTYAVTTTNASDRVTAIAQDAAATIAIDNGGTTVTNGNTASWSAGANELTVTVTNGGNSSTYTVNVTR